MNILKIQTDIFYNKKSWHLLLSDFIRPLVDSIEEGRISYLVMFRSLNGEHIQLDIHISEKHVNDLIEIIQFKLEVFLRDRPSFSEPISFALKSFFIDFPNNSFLLNLREYNKSHHYSLDISYQISKIILNVLSKDIIDNESIFTFCLYLYFGAIKAESNKGVPPKIIFTDIMDQFASNEKKLLELNVEQFEVLLSDNVTLLKEIFNDVWNSSSSEEIAWINDWIAVCSKSLLNASNNLSIVGIFNIINEHLQVTRHQYFLICRLIDRILK